MPNLTRRLVGEALGTALLLAAVVGSGIMAQRLSGGNNALALLCNTLPTGAMLTVLILVFGPLSGAHFNPAVSVALALRRELPWTNAAAYIVAQIAGGLVGVWTAHLMFELPVWQLSLTQRTGPDSGSPSSSQPSDYCSRSSAAPRERPRPCPTRSGFTSPRPTGSPRRRRLPIRR
jgi:glycerol uptake facilitator-like aquaporin